MKTIKATALLLSLLGAASLASAQTLKNLIPNGDFTARDPLQGWRVDFPAESFYVKNKEWAKATTEHARPGRKCAVIELPPGIAGNQGGKIESAFIKCEGGATYKAEIDVMTWDFSAKVFAECYTTDPRPDIARGTSIARIPAGNGLPALARVYRAQFPDPPAHSKTWNTASREFTLPSRVSIGGGDQEPEYLTLKVVIYEGTPKAGKSFVDNFRLYKVR